MAPPILFFFSSRSSQQCEAILLELLQPEVCPLSERLVHSRGGCWLLAAGGGSKPCTRVCSKENILCYETDAVWPVRTCWVCPGPAPGEQQLCSVVGLGFWSALGTLFALGNNQLRGNCFGGGSACVERVFVMVTAVTNLKSFCLENGSTVWYLLWWQMPALVCWKEQADLWEQEGIHGFLDWHQACRAGSYKAGTSL